MYQKDYQNVLDNLFNHGLMKFQRERRMIIKHRREKARDKRENGHSIKISKNKNAKINSTEMILADDKNLG